jgi:heat shock protein HtpX
MFDVLALPGIALGTILFGNLGMWDILPWGLTLATYFLSRNQLSGLTSRGKRAPLDPEAWRVDGLGRGPRLEAGRELKRTQLAAALNFAAAALLALALKSLYLGSVSAAAAGMWAGLPGLLKMFAIAVSAGWLLQRGLLTLFLKADRVRDGAFHRMVLSLARRAGIPEPAVFSGKNSPIGANAFAMGFLHHGASVTELHPILDLLTPEEAEAVMAHEVSHIRYRHLLYLIGSLSLFGMVGSGLGTTLMQMTIRCWLPVASALVLFALMRNDETMADTGAALLTGAPSALASGLRKLMLYISIHSGARQDGWVHRIFLSHPDPLIRIDRLLRMDADAPRGGPLPARHG